MLENIEKQDNKILLISEKEQQVFLPYTLKELEDYLDQFPDAYSSTDDVIKKELVVFKETFKEELLQENILVDPENYLNN